MAVDLLTPTAAPKFETFVEEQLGKARGRIRALDIGTSLLYLLAVTLGYALAVAIFELTVGGAEGNWRKAARYGGFALYALVALILLGQVVVKFYRRINPYFAARQLEGTLPDAKNSVINWLDLREEKLPGAIRNAVGLRAARDLKLADPDKAVPSGNNWFLGSLFLALILGLVIVFAMSPGRFLGLMGRAFAPFTSASIAPRVGITMVQPAAGNAVVGPNQKVVLRAQISGEFPRVNHPQAPTFHYRYQADDSWVTRYLDDDGQGLWSITVLADQVQNGFAYKISAGDAETPEFQVEVRSQPRATKFEMTYHYRPYRKLPDEMVVFPNQHAVMPRILGHRGTEIDLVVHANREVKEARFEFTFEGKKTELAATVLADNPGAFRAKFPLEHSGGFRVLFTAADGEENSDRSPYLIEVLEDGKPNVFLEQPGQDVNLPANGTLPLVGKAIDDLGLKSMTLRVQVLEGADKPALAAKPYRLGKSFSFDNGTYPLVLEYQDFLALDQLRTAAGKPFQAKTGTVLEYWLEAVDNSDFPNPEGNLGKSQAFKITIAGPEVDPKQQREDRQKAENNQKKHEKNQDQKHAKENEQRNQPGQGDNSENKQKKENLEKNLGNQGNKLEEQLNKEKDKGEAKGQEPEKSDAKEGPADKNQQPGQNKEQKPGPDNQAGNQKDQGDNKDGDQNSQAKGPGPRDGQEKQPGEAKGDGPDNNQAQAKGGHGGDDPNNNPNAQAKEGGMNQLPDQAKDKGNQSGQPEPGQAKENPAEGPAPPAGAKGGDDHGAKGMAKNGQGQGDPKQAPPATAKSGRGEGKTGEGKKADNPGAGAGNAKNDLGKPAPNQFAKQEPTQDELNKWKEEAEKRKEQAEDIAEELDRLARESKDEKVRAMAKEMLEKMGRDAENPLVKAKEAKGPNPTEKKETDEANASVAETKGKGKENAPPGEAKSAQTKEVEKAAKSGRKAGNFGPEGKGILDNYAKMKANQEFVKRGGLLQLLKLKDRVTPDLLQKAGLTEKDWQQFLKDASAYEELLSREKSLTSTKPNQAQGTTNKLITTGPRPIGSQPNAQVDPLQSGRPLPPPEFRESQNEFTKRKQ